MKYIVNESKLYDFVYRHLNSEFGNLEVYEDEEPSYEEEDDFLHFFGQEMGMFDDADDENYNFHNR